jgi:hypothetical protein
VAESRSRLLKRTGATLADAELPALSGAALATNQSQQRQQGRNANQAAKQEARARSTAGPQTRRASPSAGRTSATRSRKAVSKAGYQVLTETARRMP